MRIAKAQGVFAAVLLAFSPFMLHGADEFTLLRSKAEQDDLSCVQMVAMIHFQGKGVKRDLPEASKWFAKAAVLGDANAAFSLGLMNDEGQGIPKNAVEAFAWYHVSMALSRDVSATSKYSAALEKKLTPRQIEAAKARTAEILKQAERKKDELYEKRLAIMKAANPQIPIEELRKKLPR